MNLSTIDTGDEKFWRSEIEKIQPLAMPTDRSGGHGWDGATGFVQQGLPERLRTSLLETDDGRRRDAILIAALCVLQFRYTGNTSVSAAASASPAVGSAFAGVPDTVVSVDLADGPALKQVVDGIEEALRSAREHARPLGRILEAWSDSVVPYPIAHLRIVPGVAHAPQPAVDQRDDEVTDHPGALVSQLEFTIDLASEPATMSCRYRADLYGAETARGWLRHYLTILQGLRTDDHVSVAAVEVMDDDEWHRVLVEWNDTRRRLPVSSCLHHLFERQVDRTPGAVAVRSGSSATSYRELDESANRLAHALVARGIRPGDVVGVCVPRGAEQVAALLATVKVGAAYLPLDPDYPAERLDFILRDSRSRAVLSTPELRRAVDNGQTSVILLDDSSVAEQPTSRPATTVHPDDVAYVIYTSGSTGAPKGIALRHRGAVNNFCDFNERFAIGHGDALLGVSSPSFDMSMYDSLGVLGCGATLILPNQEETKDPASWLRLLRDHRVTIWHSAPALLALVLDRLIDDETGLPDLRLALLGGDWIPVTMPARLRSHAPGVRFISLGGATESSMDSTIHEVVETDPAWSSVPYGRPMANQRTYVLDNNQQPVPPGVPGELYLAGAGLAVGYLHRPELTADRFVTRTFAPGFTERLYRTGDRVRQHHDGQLELLGRVDFQIKVHGLRVEPGEIEALLHNHPAIDQAVVVGRGERGDVTLGAFLVRSHGSAPLAGQELRGWLTSQVPEYMVPSVFVVLDKLPTTPNGKVDRRALREQPITAESVVAGAPDFENDVQRHIWEAWCRVLNMRSITLDDDFFAIGGDSFSAIRAAHAIDKTLRPVEVFTHRTIRALAERLQSIAPEQMLLHKLTPHGRSASASLVCVPYGGGNVISYQPLADRLSDDWDLWSIALPGHELGAGQEGFASFAQTAEQCADELASRVYGPVVVYGHCAGVGLAVMLARDLEARGIDLQAVFIGGFLPPVDPRKDWLESTTSTDEAVHAYLTSIGGFDGSLDWAEIKPMVQAARHDSEQVYSFFAETSETPPKPLEAPVVCLFGDADPATEGFADRYSAWAPFAAEPLRVFSVHGGNHYFVRNNAGAVSNILDSFYFGAPLDTASATELEGKRP